MSFERVSSSIPFDDDEVDIFDPWAGEDCPVCGVPPGTGGCPRCFLIAAECFDIEDHLDEL